MYEIRIRELRKDNGFTQKELASYLQVNFRTISCWEHEKYEPDIAQIKKICRLFNVSADFLIGLDDDPE